MKDDQTFREKYRPGDKIYVYAGSAPTYCVEISYDEALKLGRVKADGAVKYRVLHRFTVAGTGRIFISRQSSR